MDVDWGLLVDSPDEAAKELGTMLHKGQLALFVGAGISKGLGAPDWHSLARMMARRTAGINGKGINRKTVPSEKLAEIFTRISRRLGSSFDAEVKKCLYYRLTKKKGNWASGTLVALGALMSGTNRGRIDTVLSLNFDSILEMYLRLYGNIAQPITTFPALIGRSDVVIFHSHGYLPYEAEDGDDTSILLTSQTYLEAMGDDASPRKKMMDYVFGHKRFLAIGLSGGDMYSRSAIAAMALRAEGTMGYWILGPNEDDDKVADLKESKIAAVRLASFADLPEFLFKIARHAAKLAI